VSSPSERIPRAALVTGAMDGVGREIALALSGDGWAIALHHQGARSRADELLREIAAKGGRTVALEADLARETDVEALLPAAEAALGPIGCLVIATDVARSETAPRDEPADWTAQVQTNLRAPLVLAQRFASALPPAAEGAIVTLLNDRHAAAADPWLASSVVRPALANLTRTLALALAPRVRVNGLRIGRGAATEEIVRAARFILAAPAMTGQIIALGAAPVPVQAHT
jgi:NAD(P)-dependent dehydrogenase (short-subunit alcohol dehydrogenase family)